MVCPKIGGEVKLVLLANLSKNDKVFIVHDGINSVADYNSLRVGVGCRMYVGCRMDVCPEANFTMG